MTVCAINSPDTISLFLAINKLGAVANMVCGISSEGEIKEAVNNLGSKFVFTLDIFMQKIHAIISDTTIEKVVVSPMTDGMSWINRVGAKLVKRIRTIPLPADSRFISWKRFIENKEYIGPVIAETNPDAIAVINYTGGTTGGSKGVQLSNKAIIAVAEQYILGEQEISRDETWLQIIPLFTGYGVTCSLMIPLLAGMTMIVRMPLAESIGTLCKKYRPNHIVSGPAMWEEFADANEDMDLSYLISPITGGDTLRPGVEKKINDYLQSHGSKYPLFNGYGMTEVGAAVCVNFIDKYEFGSVGMPFVKNVISAFDLETGEELKYNQEGELCIYTPSVMSGYVNKPEETNNILRVHKDGKVWVHTGDLGYVTENGYVHISGRLKRYSLYINNGVAKKVFSLDIEKILLRHDAVNNCAVVPKSDPQKNQVPVAYIMLKNVEYDEAKVEAELQAICKENLEPPYWPKQYVFVKEFPHTKIGKVDYLELEKRLK